MKPSRIVLGTIAIVTLLGGSAEAQVTRYDLLGGARGDLTYGAESGRPVAPGSAYWSRGDLTYGARRWAAPGFGDQTYRPLGCTYHRGRTYCR